MVDIGSIVNFATGEGSISGKPIGEKAVLTGLVLALDAKNRQKVRDYLTFEFPAVFDKVKDKYFPSVFYMLIPESERPKVREFLQTEFPEAYAKYNSMRILPLPGTKRVLTEREKFEYET